MDDFFNLESSARNRDSSEGHSFATEEKIVKAILKQANASEAYKSILSECRKDTGVNNINLSWFLNRYQSFPLWLGTRRVEWQRDTFGTLLKRFTHTPCYKAWEEVNDTKAEDDCRTTACVFTWPSFGICCIHQHTPSQLADSDGIWITRKLPSFEEKFIIEPFSQLLKALSWNFPG